MELEKFIETGDIITYAGGCDVIRLGSMQWAQFENDELIENKKYEVIGSMCMQTACIMEGKDFKMDSSGTRYRYFKVNNESGFPIYVWDGFFAEIKPL